MKKIKSVFERDYEGTHLVYDSVVPGCEWVLAGEGVATRKYDGSCCAIIDGELFRRYDCKKGKSRRKDLFRRKTPTRSPGIGLGGSNAIGKIPRTNGSWRHTKILGSIRKTGHMRQSALIFREMRKSFRKIFLCGMEMKSWKMSPEHLKESGNI